MCHHVCITPVSLIARGAEGCLYLTGTRDGGRERRPSATLAVDETVEVVRMMWMMRMVQMVQMVRVVRVSTSLKEI